MPPNFSETLSETVKMMADILGRRSVTSLQDLKVDFNQEIRRVAMFSGSE